MNGPRQVFVPLLYYGLLECGRDISRRVQQRKNRNKHREEEKKKAENITVEKENKNQRESKERQTKHTEPGQKKSKRTPTPELFIVAPPVLRHRLAHVCNVQVYLFVCDASHAFKCRVWSGVLMPKAYATETQGADRITTFCAPFAHPSTAGFLRD